MQHIDLAALLERRGLVTGMQIRHAAALSRDKGHSWLEHLVMTGVIDDLSLAQTIAQGTRLAICDDARLQAVRPDVLAEVPADLALEHKLVPFAIDSDGDLLVAMVDPTDTAAVTEVEFFVGRRLLRTVGRATAIGWALHTHYGARSALYPAPQPAVYEQMRATG